LKQLEENEDEDISISEFKARQKQEEAEKWLLTSFVYLK